MLGRFFRFPFLSIGPLIVFLLGVVMQTHVRFVGRGHRGVERVKLACQVFKLFCSLKFLLVISAMEEFELFLQTLSLHAVTQQRRKTFHLTVIANLPVF